MSDITISRDLLECLVEQHITAHGRTNAIAREAQLALSRPAPAVQVPEGWKFIRNPKAAPFKELFIHGPEGQKFVVSNVSTGEGLLLYKLAEALLAATAPAPSAAAVQVPDSGVTVLPDGSAFALASFPLPANHWLYAPREEWDNERDEFVECPHPILTNASEEAVVAAVRYAVRGATMCGKESDFDPDALVQNAVYALCGRAAAPAPATCNYPDCKCPFDAPADPNWCARGLPKNAPATVARCDTCDGTGDVHDATGEWRGRCPHCAPATVATEAVAQGVEQVIDALPDDWSYLAYLMLNAGAMYWKAAVRERGPGAVQWLRGDDGALFVFTRGEYADELVSAVKSVTQWPVQEKPVAQGGGIDESRIKNITLAYEKTGVFGGGHMAVATQAIRFALKCIAKEFNGTEDTAIATPHAYQYGTALMWPDDLSDEDKREALPLYAVAQELDQAFVEIANELGCKPDNEAMMEAIHTLKQERFVVPKGCNSFGLDINYFVRKMGRIIRGIGSYKPDEFARECARMAATADAVVLRESEFQTEAVAQECFIHTAGPVVPKAMYDQLMSNYIALSGKAVAQGGGVDVEKVMALVEEYRALIVRACSAHFGAVRRVRLSDAAEKRDQIRALLASPAPVGGWQPIETAPKDGSAFIATGFNYGKDGGPRHYCMALWEQGEWREASEWNGHSSLAYLTHWQPLPAAPAIDKQSEVGRG